MPSGFVTSTTLKRIQREIADLKKEDLGDITLGPAEDDLFHWRATIPGPEGSVYEGGVFNVDINLASDYPFSAPRMTFRTRIYHMNISDRGGICIDILKHNWSPALSLFKVILSLSSLLTDPNPRDPLVPAIAQEYTRNRAKHDQTAHEWTQLYARPPPPPPPPPPAPVAPTVSRVKGKGKEKAVTPSPSPVVPTTRPVRTPGATEVITIDDSDDESNARLTVTQQQSTKRKREAEVVDVDSEAADTMRVRRRRTGPARRDPAPEVIVIED